MTLEKKPICVVLTGAGISAESGIPTFRAEDGLWAGHKVEEVCTPEALQKNRAKVLDFYNQRRKNAAAAKPNAAHLALVELEKAYDVRIITQNVDDLHERAGSSKVLHLHGELNKARSSFDESYIVDCFGGEMVPMLERAVDIVEQADVVLVIGTSLQVYPANGLVNEAPSKAPIYLIDPNPNTGFVRKQVIAIKEKAGEGVPKVVAELLENVKNT
ncbi:MAG: Sir2 family NAD-dependent protein deacetylase [Haemophilus parainfluenzae]|nr:Sir2 family NAD-dependent protein deacetylase [Haemophilus parainfluenzae]